MDIQHVVVPLDESSLSRRALAPAVAVARGSGADLLLYSRVSRSDEGSRREKHLAEVASTVDGPEVSVHVGEAPAASAGIEQFTRAHEGALVCMSSHGRSGVGTSLLGSVAEETLRRVMAPILLVGPGCDESRSPVEGEVVACVDGSAMAEAMLDHAAGWAAGFGMGLCLLQVVSENWQAEVAAAGVDPGDVREDSYVAGLASRLRGRGLDPDWEVAHGRQPRQPADRIVQVIADRGAGLAALSTHGRTGLRRLVIGSVAMRVVHDSPCPVLVARPAALDG